MNHGQPHARCKNFLGVVTLSSTIIPQSAPQCLVWCLARGRDFRIYEGEEARERERKKEREKTRPSKPVIPKKEQHAP